jgi:Zn ribbon nucleic-acid-binding protein
MAENGITVVVCPECGHIYKHYSNLYGKVCICCGYIMETDFIPKTCRDNIKKKEEMKEKVLKHIKKKILENINANR